MVRQVTSYQASDGSLHGTAEQAARHEARLQLKQLGIFNEGTINAVMENAWALDRILRELTKEVDPPAEVAPDAIS
jgi:hypothetical protein